MVSYSGPFVSQFEELVAVRCGARAAAATSAGTTAIHVGLHVLGVRTGNLVMVPNLTFIASVNAIWQCGAQPWLVDVQCSNWSIDPGLLEETLKKEAVRDRDGNLIRKSCGRTVSAVLPVYMLGQPADMDAICAIADRWNLPVLADGAAALGSSVGERKLAQLGADLTALSFNANKIITTGGGGMLVGNDQTMMSRVRHLTTTARLHDKGYVHDEAGFNYRLTNLCAAVGVAQMAKLDAFLKAKATIAERYATSFSDLPDLKPFPMVEGVQGNHWYSGIFLPDWSPKDVAALRQHLAEAGVKAPPFWQPIHMQPPYRDAPRTRASVSTRIWEKIQPLPCSTNLSEDQQERVITAVRAFAEGKTAA